MQGSAKQGNTFRKRNDHSSRGAHTRNRATVALSGPKATCMDACPRSHLVEIFQAEAVERCNLLHEGTALRRRAGGARVELGSVRVERHRSG